LLAAVYCTAIFVSVMMPLTGTTCKTIFSTDQRIKADALVIFYLANLNFPYMRKILNMRIEASMKNEDLAKRLSGLRRSKALSLDELAEKSGISRATLSRIERGDTSPTAVALGQLAKAFGLSMADLFGFGPASHDAKLTRAEQPVWTDPETGFVRRSVSPAVSGFRGSVIEGVLPAGAVISYSVPPLPDLEHHLVLLEGALCMTLGEERHDLQAGDCLRFRLNAPNSYHAPGPDPVRYLLTVITP
jgi:transcriptional regulator with XRE-family HTH domain